MVQIYEEDADSDEDDIYIVSEEWYGRGTLCPAPPPACSHGPDARAQIRSFLSLVVIYGPFARYCELYLSDFVPYRPSTRIHECVFPREGSSHRLGARADADHVHVRRPYSLVPSS